MRILVLLLIAANLGFFAWQYSLSAPIAEQFDSLDALPQAKVIKEHSPTAQRRADEVASSAVLIPAQTQTHKDLSSQQTQVQSPPSVTTLPFAGGQPLPQPQPQPQIAVAAQPQSAPCGTAFCCAYRRRPLLS